VRRIVLDPGVLVSALITPAGAPARVLGEARDGRFELIVSPHLLDELEGVLEREKFRRYVDIETVREYIETLRREARVVPDPEAEPPLRCADPDDDYLIALAHSENATLVSGDGHLLDLGPAGVPVVAPVELL